MIFPEVPTDCQAKDCNELATSFHPYIGYVCKNHLTQAQRAFSQNIDGSELQRYAEIIKIRKLYRKQEWQPKTDRKQAA